MRIVPDLRQAIIKGWEYVLNTGKVVDQEHWQGVKAPRPMFEALDYDFKAIMPKSLHDAKEQIKPNLPWADAHFEERIGGLPLNPPPSHEIWPFGNNNNKAFQKDQIFDHTYPERFWPTSAGKDIAPGEVYMKNKGIRFEYGDLSDVITKLITDPYTRQAFLPIWFPEDTGKPSNIRVPCSIGYHFIIRDNRLDVTYWMRSLDMLRHFQDDIYLCCRLAAYIVQKLVNSGKMNMPLQMGYMKFHAVSAHIFDGEQKLLERKIKKHYY